MNAPTEELVYCRKDAIESHVRAILHGLRICKGNLLCWLLIKFVSCLQDLSRIEVKIQRADSPTSQRNNFFLPIGDDRERPRSPELLYPPTANITEVWTLSFLRRNRLIQFCFLTAQKESSGRYSDNRGTWLCTIERILICTTFATALEMTVLAGRKYFRACAVSLESLYNYVTGKVMSFSHSLFGKCSFVFSCHRSISSFCLNFHQLSWSWINRAKGLFWLKEKNDLFLSAYRHLINTTTFSNTVLEFSIHYKIIHLTHALRVPITSNEYDLLRLFSNATTANLFIMYMFLSRLQI